MIKTILSKLVKVVFTGAWFVFLVHLPTMVPGNSIFWAGLLVFSLAVLSLRELGVYPLIDKWFE